MLLSQKRKTVFKNFIGLLQCRQNFAHFEKKGRIDKLNISEFFDPDKCSYLYAQKLLF